MRRRDFLKGLAIAAGSALIPWHGPAGVEAAERPKELTAADAAPPPVLSSRVPHVVCGNCKRFPRREGSAVCSPLCNWYRADPLVNKMGVVQWERWRRASIAFMAGEASWNLAGLYLDRI